VGRQAGCNYNLADDSPDIVASGSEGFPANTVFPSDPRGGAMGTERILSIGKDVGLLLLRSEVLRRDGYRVIATTDCRTAIEIIRKLRVSLVLLCHSVPKHESSIVRERAKHIGGITVLQVAVAQGPELPSREGYVAASPGALLKSIESSLHHSSSRVT
jgi:CheY-like chemotaxis protein